MRHELVVGLALCLVFVTSQVGKCHGYYDTYYPNNGLQFGFYKGKCPNTALDVENYIANKAKEAFYADTTLLPALLRMLFHDCFVQGCDASILIDGPTSEKNARANQGVRGFELIESLKASIEQECPNVVSCADIIVIATKVLVKEAGGPDYPVRTGRRDGIVSNMANVNLPSPFLTVPESIAAFAAKGFSAEEMVVLLGCHTVGITHCANFQGRLYPGTSQFDPMMDPILRYQLMQTCPKEPITENFTFLDQTPNYMTKIDNAFYTQLLKNRGVLAIDQALSRHPETSRTVWQLSTSDVLFKWKLALAMMKLQEVEVLTGSQGQIRKFCNQINYY